jgi:hypothetical protein
MLPTVDRTSPIRPAMDADDRARGRRWLARIRLEQHGRSTDEHQRRMAALGRATQGGAQ